MTPNNTIYILEFLRCIKVRWTTTSGSQINNALTFIKTNIYLSLLTIANSRGRQIKTRKIIQVHTWRSRWRYQQNIIFFVKTWNVFPYFMKALLIWDPLVVVHRTFIQRNGIWYIVKLWIIDTYLCLQNMCLRFDI
jgi:hypothetical protein